MKGFLIGLSAGLLMFLLIYLLGSFVNVSLNPKQWTVDSREFVGMMGGLLTIIVIAVTTAILNDKTKHP